MPVNARRLIRKMRGGAQAHLIEASDGHYYVVKFQNNPQHRRILVNEWIAATFLGYLGLPTPDVAMIRISASFVANNPDLYIQLGNSHRLPTPGWHFGSRFPGDPARTAVYDFLPDALLEKIENVTDFRGVLAFDKWVANADARQAIFFRARIGPEGGPGEVSPRLGFVAQMVDNGYVFEGPHWRLSDSPLQGLYFRPLVYRSVRGWADFEPWLERIRHFPEEVVDQALKQIPPAWLEQDEAELQRLLERFLMRRKRVPDLIEGCRAGRSDPFPAWMKLPRG
jgi:hypothetical protein